MPRKPEEGLTEVTPARLIVLSSPRRVPNSEGVQLANIRGFFFWFFFVVGSNRQCIGLRRKQPKPQHHKNTQENLTSTYSVACPFHRFSTLARLDSPAIGPAKGAELPKKKKKEEKNHNGFLLHRSSFSGCVCSPPLPLPPRDKTSPLLTYSLH